MSEFDTRRFLIGWKDGSKEFATMVYLSQVPTTHKGYSIDAFTGTSELFVMSPDGGVIGNAKAYEV
mgnify:FL=1